MLYCLKWHRSRRIWHTLSTRSRSWIKRIVSRGVRRSSSSKFNRATILKKKQRGKARTSSIRAIQILSYHTEGTCSCLMSLLGPFSFQIFGQYSFLRGRAVTIISPNANSNPFKFSPSIQIAIVKEHWNLLYKWCHLKLYLFRPCQDIILVSF
jgi:hypothetical protein